MLTRIRNALLGGQTTVSVPQSKLKIAIARLLQDEGFIESFEEVGLKGKPQKSIHIHLKYVGKRRDRRSVISGLERISRPGRRVYVGKRKIPWIHSGMGVAILSTPKGVMTDMRARQLGVGGELLCKVW
jgi:small subunit ribosomal protein S8